MATTPQDLEAEEARRSLSRNQVLAAVGILFLVLLLLWFFVFKGGGEPASQPAPPPIGAPNGATPSPAPGKGHGNGKGDGQKGNVETFTVFAPKDPFKPLLTSSDTATGATGTGDTGTGTAGTGDNGTGDNGTGDNGTGTDNGTGDGGTGDDGSSVGGHRVKLIDVFTDKNKERASVQVDGTVYTVDVGETFADSFKLLSTSGNCASLLFGDDQFSLCEGQEILK